MTLGEVRSLVTTHVFPWPPSSGTTIRVAATIDALSELGPVDVVCMVDASTASAREVPEGALAARVLVVPRPPQRRGAISRARWVLGSGRPWSLARDFSSARQALREWSHDYDFVWFGGAEGFVAFSRDLNAPAACNFDDLEDVKTQRLLDLDDGDRTRSSITMAIRDAMLRLDRARWSRLQRDIGAHTGATVVCSEHDRSLLGLPRVAVVPNVYPEPPRAVGRPTVDGPPTVTFVGVLSYAPNADAASFLVHEVLPVLRGLVPNVRLRLVGPYDDRCASLGAAEGVELTGRVPLIDPELSTTDLIVAPIRYGGGTRIKILEAFAHRIPVVSTTVGAEGLGVVDGTHLLLADDAKNFAHACARLLTPAATEERVRLSEAAWNLWSERFRVEALTGAVLSTVSRVMQ